MTPEQESAVFMSGPSDTDLFAATTKAIGVKPLTPTSFAQKHDRFESPKASGEKGLRQGGRHTPTEMIRNKTKNLEITPVPAAIATKSSKVSLNDRMILSRRTTSSKVAEEQTSFIDTTNGACDQKTGIQALTMTCEMSRKKKANGPNDLKEATINTI